MDMVLFNDIQNTAAFSCIWRT